AWNAALEAELEQAGRRLSSVTVQLLFNLPTLAVLGYAGWLTAMNFFSNTILSSDFFVHAFWTIALVLLLSFFLLQGLIRLAAGRERLVARVFERLQTSLERDVRLAETPVWTQAQRILGLAR
uniref:hypothetical protein n=1 Tax=Desulfosarcina cetonica TaxID=90730 RepID=UPI00155DADE9